jgi:hypothetical protein
MTPNQYDNWRKVYGEHLSNEEIDVIKSRLELEVRLLEGRELIKQRTEQREKDREKKSRVGKCKHGVAAKYCRVPSCEG